MSKVRRGGYVFLSWKGDHDPKHVHVYLDGKLIAKWDLENGRVMRGVVNTRVLRLLEALQAEGLI